MSLHQNNYQKTCFNLRWNETVFYVIIIWWLVKVKSVKGVFYFFLILDCLDIIILLQRDYTSN